MPSNLFNDIRLPIYKLAKQNLLPKCKRHLGIGDSFLQVMSLIWPRLNRLRVARRARSVLVQQPDGPLLPSVEVGGRREGYIRARRRQRAIEGCFCWRLRLRRRGCARGQRQARNQQAEVSHCAAPW